MNSRMKLLIGSVVVLVLVALVGSLLVGVYYRKLENPFIRFVASSFPAATVNGRTISYGTYLEHVDAQRAFLSGPLTVDAGTVRELTDLERKEALDRAIRIEAVAGLAMESKVEVTPLDIDRAYDDLIARAGTSTSPEEIRAFLKAQFGWDEIEYKKYLLRPAFTEEILRSKSGDTFDATLQARIDGAKRYLQF